MTTGKLARCYLRIKVIITTQLNNLWTCLK